MNDGTEMMCYRNEFCLYESKYEIPDGMVGERRVRGEWKWAMGGVCVCVWGGGGRGGGAYNGVGRGCRCMKTTTRFKIQILSICYIHLST